MNESLIYLNTIFHSEKDFEEVWKSFDCDKSTEGLKKEVSKRIESIEKNLASLDDDQEKLLIENLNSLIKKVYGKYSIYDQHFKYYDFRVYHTQQYFSLDIIEDAEASEKYRQKMVKECEENRDSKLVEYNKKKSTVKELMNILKDVQKKLSLEQIKIPGLVMDKGDMSTLIWQKNDTDLLELVTALFESGSITNSTKDLTRKEAINAFMQFFGMEIKDAESKLSRATSRKKDVSQYLTNLKTTFEDYAKAKDERLDSQRY
jgi:hypothetical protein